MILSDNLRLALTGGLPSHVREMYQLVQPPDPPASEREVRGGNPDGDGGYVMTDDFHGWEWEVAETMPAATLDRFRQICPRINQPVARPADFLRRRRKLAVLRKLHQRFAPDIPIGEIIRQ
jgi:hypothetical protein